MPRLSKFTLLLLATLALGACKSPEERAAEYYASALDLMDEGEIERALVELRNVFQNDGFHQEARLLYADTQLARGEIAEAYSQYLRLVEQYPDMVNVRLQLAEMSVDQGDWDGAERHGRAAIELSPELPRSRAIELALAYRDAIEARIEADRVAVAEAAIAEITAQPDNLLLRRVAMNHLLEAERYADVFPHVEKALELSPESFQFNRMKLQLFAAQGLNEDLGTQLKAMVELYPDNDDLKQDLIRWYFAKEDFAGAEAFLRAEAGALTGDTAPHMEVVSLVMRIGGRDAARAELQALRAANEGTPVADFYGAFLAGMDFEDGKADDALAALDAILATAEPSDQTRDISIAKAQMLLSAEDRAAAEAIVNAVLTEDSSHVEALKLRASWLIDSDRPGEAILALRTAQSQAPRDPAIMTLLAAAFERDGSPDLAGEQLAQAVVASDTGVEEALRYARFLMSQDRVGVAETVLRDARRTNGDIPLLLVELSRVLISQEDWGGVQEITSLLKSTEQERFINVAKQLEATMLLARNRFQEGIDLLADQAAAASDDIRTIVALAVTQIQAGQLEDSRQTLTIALRDNPDSSTLRLLLANLDALDGNYPASEAALQAIIADEPQAELPVRLLYGVLMVQGKVDAAITVLEDGIKNVPYPRQLLWIQASRFEAENRFEDAIAIYEQIYAGNSNDVIAANNLASMLSVHRTDEASLERAYAIARRLRSQPVPAFQDTYGWIEYRRGNLEDALPYLQAGAAGLPDDPVAQFHLAMVYADLGRTAEAIAQFKRMQELAGDRALPQLAIAQERLITLASDSQ